MRGGVFSKNIWEGASERASERRNENIIVWDPKNILPLKYCKHQENSKNYNLYLPRFPDLPNLIFLFLKEQSFIRHATFKVSGFKSYFFLKSK
jgi:hypothetical protein